MACDTFDFHLTSPAGVALLRMLEEALCTSIVAILFEMQASELARKPLLVNETGTVGGCDGCGIRFFGFFVVTLE